MNNLLGVVFIRVKFLADVQKKPRSLQRQSPALGAAPGAAPGARHSVTSLRETTASMRSLILIKIPSTVSYKILIEKNLLRIRKPLKINEIPNSHFKSLLYFI